ncbi:MAG: sigma-70 family RNA polymerase sigma factor [Bacteroidales bacterium]|nr:sigma-70 family RNA polymerase sigma factor [Bacteroidales bacterium]
MVQDDIYYIDKVMGGDISAYSFLVNKHRDMVYTIALKIVGNCEDAEEIAQDVFIKAYQSLKKFKRKSKFSTWLYRIAYNSSISKVRKKRIEVSAINENIIENYNTFNDDESEYFEQINFETKRKYLFKILDNLPEEENLLINLFYMNNNSINEISEITGLKISNLKVKLFRIRKKIYIEIMKMFKNNIVEIL